MSYPVFTYSKSAIEFQNNSKLTKNTTERPSSGVFMANYERISHIVLVAYIVDFEQAIASW